jgi:hypothetical protein
MEDGMATAAAELYRAYSPRPFTRAERDSTTILFGELHWRLERVLQAVLENRGTSDRGAARRDARRSLDRPRGRRHRSVLSHQLHHGSSVGSRRAGEPGGTGSAS